MKLGNVEIVGVFSVEGDGDSCVYISHDSVERAGIDALVKYTYAVVGWGTRDMGFRLTRVSAPAGFTRDAVVKGPRGSIKFQAEAGRFQFQNQKLRAAPRPPEPVRIISHLCGQVLDISFPPNFKDKNGRLVGSIELPNDAVAVNGAGVKTKDQKVAEATELVRKLMVDGKLGAREALIRAAIKYGN